MRSGNLHWLDSLLLSKYSDFMDQIESSGRVGYWDGLSQYDLETAVVMLAGGRYLYVGFMCHQAVEKALKAHHWFSRKTEPDYTHSLARHARQSGIDASLTEAQRGFLDTLDPLNIESRYPTDKALLSATMTRERCEFILSSTKGLVQWLRQTYLR